MARLLRIVAQLCRFSEPRQIKLITRRISRSNWAQRFSLGLVSLVLSGAIVAAPLQYIYDEIGRLVGAIDATGNGSTYNYDAAGNIVSITATGVVSIISFTPKAGPVGASITISVTSIVFSNTF